MQLRPYQEQAVEAVITAREAGLRRALYVLPTGTGKTQVFVGIRRRLQAKTLVLAHREELLDQAAMRFLSVDPQCYPAIEQGTRKAHRWAEVIAASVQTLVRGNRLEWFRPDLVVLDEAHHAVSPTHRKVLERFGCFSEGGPFLVGCTATPKRLDRLNLQSVFQQVVFNYSIGEAIEDGWLCDIRGYRVKTGTDLSGVKTTAGDYQQGDLEKAIDVEDRTGAILRHWGEVAADRPTVVFCGGVAHAEHFTQAFRQQGVAAEHVDGGMSRDQRGGILKRFKSGQVQVVCNVDILTEGFDHPAVSCIVMARPTQSWGLYVQCVGRGTRLAEGKRDLIVIDAVDNCDRHSLATVPAILDLPAGLDLQGHTLREAAAKVAELGERAALLADANDRQQELVFADLDTMLEEVDLLAAVGVPPEARQGHCKLAWRKVGPDSYYLNCGKGRDVALTRDALGCWVLSLRQRGLIHKQGRAPFAADARPAEVLHICDYRIRKIWPDAIRFADADAPKPQNPPTEKQRGLLRRFRVEPHIIAQLDRSGATALISQHLARAERSASR